jgi:Rrf2 family cysteine metabolism transcriptional repressor
MKITARTGYASLAILDLGINASNRQVQAKEISERRGIPLKFLEQILIQLRNAGLVQSVRGAFGGYLLARSPEEISLRDVVEAVEGELNLFDKSLTDELLISVWSEVEEAFVGKLESISIQNLVDRKLSNDNVLDFQI